MFAARIFKYLSHCHCACVQMNITVAPFSVRRRTFSYQCKDKFEGTSESNTIKENTRAPEDLHNESRLLQVNQDLSEEDIQRRSLQVTALSFLAMVDENSLSSQQLEIHQAHVRALKTGDELYKDPVTGYLVMSRLAHLTRGDCCGNACRHCPFGQKSAPEKFRRTYNSAFYD